MSEKKSIRREDALVVARELCDLLKPFVERIAVCGSLRRGKRTVSDVELLLIPKTTEEADGLFDKVTISLADREIDNLLKQGVLTKRPTIDGRFLWGPQNKLAIHHASGIPVDLFATDEKRWWIAKVIRTGGKETNLLLTRGAINLGRKLHAYGDGLTDTNGEKLVCASEEDVFRYCGVEFMEPIRRL